MSPVSNASRRDAPRETVSPNEIASPGIFVGRWLGGSSMIVAPLLLLAGILLRIRFDFFFPQQLQASSDHPRLIFAAYSLVLAGNIALWPGIVALAGMIEAKAPRWGLWGGAMVLFGLFARTFHAGADHLAFQIVRVQGVTSAVQVVSDSYGAPHVVKMLNPIILFGWLVLAIGAHRSGVLALPRAIALGAMAGLMMGVLKGSSWVSAICAAGLCIALVPLGVRVLRSGPLPSPLRMVGGFLAAVVALAGLYYIGQAG